MTVLTPNRRFTNQLQGWRSLVSHIGKKSSTGKRKIPPNRRNNQNLPSDPRYIDLAPAPLLGRSPFPSKASPVAADAAKAAKAASLGTAPPAPPAALALPSEASRGGVESEGEATKLLPSRSTSCITDMAFSDVGPDHGTPPAWASPHGHRRVCVFCWAT